MIGQKRKKSLAKVNHLVSQQNRHLRDCGFVHWAGIIFKKIMFF